MPKLSVGPLSVGPLPVTPEPAGEEMVTESTTIAKNERVREIEIELPDGRRVILGAPALPSMRIAPLLMGEDEIKSGFVNGLQLMQYRALTYIKEIDGQTQPMLTDPNAANVLFMRLGEEGFSIIFDAVNQLFPAASFSQAKVIKKNSY